MLGAGTASAWLGIAAKIQVIPLVLALPVLAIAFDRRPRQAGSPERGFGDAPWGWAFIFAAIFFS